MYNHFKRFFHSFIPTKHLSFINYIRINYFSKIISESKNYKVIPLKHTICDFDKTSKIIIRGNLFLNNGKLKGSKSEMHLKLEKNSVLTINGNFSFAYGCIVRVFENAKLTVGNNSYINVDSEIICNNSIKIGDNVAIARNVVIIDTDAHSLYVENDQKNTVSAPILIGNHVWIGIGSIILKGVTIGEGSVVAAGSVVNKNVPPHCLVAGVPAKVIKKNIRWEL